MPYIKSQYKKGDIVLVPMRIYEIIESQIDPALGVEYLRRHSEPTRLGYVGEEEVFSPEIYAEYIEPREPTLPPERTKRRLRIRRG